MNQWETITENFNRLLEDAAGFENHIVHREVLLLYDLYNTELETHLPAPDLLCPSSTGNIELVWFIDNRVISVEFAVRDVTLDVIQDGIVVSSSVCKHNELVEKLRPQIDQESIERDE